MYRIYVYQHFHIWWIWKLFSFCPYLLTIIVNKLIFIKMLRFWIVRLPLLSSRLHCLQDSFGWNFETKSSIWCTVKFKTRVCTVAQDRLNSSKFTMQMFLRIRLFSRFLIFDYCKWSSSSCMLCVCESWFTTFNF